MRIINEQELKNILDKHGKWLRNEENGERANLRYANLRYADLTSADLRSANLTSANLKYANLRYANLTSADLTSANLKSADLRYANLTSADFRYANLTSANLSYANLSYANLRSANLSFANLSYADLRYANLSSADLTSIREDFFKVLSEAILEIVGLYDAILRGKINGSQYSGACACLMGTIANVRKVNVETLACNSSRESERWFLAIQEGDVPRSNPVSKITKQWIEEFCKENKIKLPKYKLVSSDKHPRVFKAEQ